MAPRRQPALRRGPRRRERRRVRLRRSALDDAPEPVRPIGRADAADRRPIDRPPLTIDATALVGAVAANALVTGSWKGAFADGPWYGVWAALLVGSLVRRPAWRGLPGAARGVAFLLSLVWCASLMPAKELPSASWQETLVLGLISSALDDVPLTMRALERGGYAGGVHAYAVGFGGSTVRLRSSAGVAISKDLPESRHVPRWLRDGSFVVVAYGAGFFAPLWILGRHANEPHRPASDIRDRSPAGAELRCGCGSHRHSHGGVARRARLPRIQRSATTAFDANLTGDPRLSVLSRRVRRHRSA